MKEDAHKKFERLLGERLAKKINDDGKAATTVYRQALCDLTIDTIKNRLDLVRDEIGESRFNAIREELLLTYTQAFTAELTCQLSSLCALLHVSLRKRAAEFIAHMAVHFDAEEEDHRVSQLSSLLEMLKGAQHEHDAETVHAAAKDYSSNN